MIAIEKTSPNRDSVITGSTGIPYHDIHGKPQYLFQAAAERGIRTAGIGDGGNEVGSGRIRHAVERIMPAGQKTAAAADHLVVAAVSDWGAYGVAAALGCQLSQPELAVTADDIERALIISPRGDLAAASRCAPRMRPGRIRAGSPSDHAATATRAPSAGLAPRG